MLYIRGTLPIGSKAKAVRPYVSQWHRLAGYPGHKGNKAKQMWNHFTVVQQHGLVLFPTLTLSRSGLPRAKFM